MKHILAIFLVTALIGCKTSKQTSVEDSSSIIKKWELRVLDGEDISTIRPVYLDFSKENTVSGFIGCNRLTGSYLIENKTQIRFLKLATTRMMCSEQEMNLERKVLELLNTTDNFTLDNGKLMLNIGRRAPLATFYEMTENEIANKYWKLIKLNGKTVKMDENQEREQYFTLRSDGSMAGFAGCNYFNGQYELASGNRIKFNDNIAISLKACPDVDLDESAFMQVFYQTESYFIEDEILSLKAGKNAPIAIFEAVYF